MTDLFLPAEYFAVFAAAVTLGLGVLFAAPDRFHLRSPGGRAALVRILVGAIWATDASLKFLPGAPPKLAYWLIVGVGQDQPSLSWWFSYWAAVVGGNPSLWWYGTGALEALVATALLLGLARRFAYLGGFVLGLALWAIPEGFGGPYLPSTTDVGVGLLYAVVSLMLLQMDSVSGPARLAVDPTIERRWRGWRVFGGPALSRGSPGIRSGTRTLPEPFTTEARVDEDLESPPITGPG
jgi:uncharacterized membrane protein YphA (DoxX/SURF4 family)